MSAGSRTFTWDLANRLKTTTLSPTTTTYTYDGDGIRTQASTGTADAEKTNFIWDVNRELPQVVREENGAHAIYRRYFYGIGRLWMSTLEDNSNAFYFHYDPLGSVRDITDQGGATQWTYDYEPFGATRMQTGSTPSNLMKFAGEYEDPTGLYHLRARAYDPGSGRFTASDPLDLALALAANDSDGSAYAYVLARPTVYVDPSGKTLAAPIAGKSAARFVLGLTDGLSATPSGARYPQADGCVRRASGTSGYRRFSALFPTARLLPFPFHAGLSINATPTTCRGSEWNVHWWMKVDTSALVGPFGEFRLLTVGAVRGSAGGWRALPGLTWGGRSRAIR